MPAKRTTLPPEMAWRLIVRTISRLGWKMVQPRRGQLYYTDSRNREGTVVLDMYDNVVWRWYVDHYVVQSRGYKAVAPDRPLVVVEDGGESSIVPSTEITCTAAELISVAEWLAVWLPAYRLEKPLHPLHAIVPLAAEYSARLCGYMWTDKAERASKV